MLLFDFICGNATIYDKLFANGNKLLIEGLNFASFLDEGLRYKKRIDCVVLYDVNWPIL